MARFILGQSMLILPVFSRSAIAQGQPFYDVTAFGAFSSSHFRLSRQV